jgi:hypothetical protein
MAIIEFEGFAKKNTKALKKKVADVVTEQDEIAVRKATPAETAAHLVKEYDSAFERHRARDTRVEPEIAAVLRIAAKLADFVATQYEID